MTADTKRDRYILLGILLLALALRLINLSGRTLWYDEAFAVLFAETGWDSMLDGTLSVSDGDASDVHPLLYYELLHLWMRVFGQSPEAVRALSVVFGVLTVAAVYWLAKGWFGMRGARASALFLAIAPFHIQYSQETRMYALLGLALCCTTLVYWRAWQTDRWYYWLGFGVLAGMSMYVQQLAAFYLAALGLLPLVLHRKQDVVKTFLAVLLALLVYMPWLVHLPDQLNKLDQYWVEKPNILHLWLALRTFVSVNLDFSAGWWLPTFMLAAVFTVLLLYRGVSVLKETGWNFSGESLGVFWILWLTFVPMLLMWLVSQVMQPVFLGRALLPSAIMFYIALAWLFVRARMPWVISLILGIAWGVIIVFGLVTHYGWDTFPNAPFDKAGAYLRHAVVSGDAIVHGNKITALPMIYYERDLPQSFVQDIPGTGSDTLASATQDVLGIHAATCIAEACAGADRVWYVAFAQLSGEMDTLVVEDPENIQYDSLAWLRAHYREDDHISFADLDVILFSNPDLVAHQAICPGE